MIFCLPWKIKGREGLRNMILFVPLQHESKSSDSHSNGNDGDGVFKENGHQRSARLQGGRA